MDVSGILGHDVIAELAKGIGLVLGSALAVIVGRALGALMRMYEAKRDELLSTIEDKQQFITEARARTLVTAVEQYAKTQIGMRGPAKLALALEWADDHDWPITRAHIEQAVGAYNEYMGKCPQVE